MVWVPGHQGIRGNEIADELARIGASTRFQGPEPALGISKQLRSALKRWTEDCSKEQWRQTQGCRQSKTFISGPDKARTEWLLKRSRQALNPLIGILTGHCRLRKHLHQMGLEADPVCPRCGEEEETAWHFLSTCEALGRLRQSIFGSPEIQEEDAGLLFWTDILAFLLRSGRFSAVVEVDGGVLFEGRQKGPLGLFVRRRASPTYFYYCTDQRLCKE